MYRFKNEYRLFSIARYNYGYYNRWFYYPQIIHQPFPAPLDHLRAEGGFEFLTLGAVQDRLKITFLARTSNSEESRESNRMSYRKSVMLITWWLVWILDRAGLHRCVRSRGLVVVVGRQIFLLVLGIVIQFHCESGDGRVHAGIVRIDVRVAWSRSVRIGCWS